MVKVNTTAEEFKRLVCDAQALGFSNACLAEELGTSVGSIGRYSTGNSSPSHLVLDSLAKKLRSLVLK